ncbi:hypothetical protein GCM10010172_60320 [Paractinoplanes ferrugineus]|uniref:Tat pathway signal sequence domain protein n=1 Tax=Paractinoplanes ferrugineus TaxID=113564 RepID=A0A919MLD4_9ACTN|nr:hypothetical protein [Actinoplanes ferrugineus]GIE16710.1 hypothetical protein Afe05nite_85500 [Actinoplanes ferrugineus]
MTAIIRRALLTATATAAAAATTLGVPATAAFAQAAPCVQNIAVINNGAYEMSFAVASRTGITSTPTSTYLINNFRLVDLTATPIPEGSDVRPVVTATAGNTEPATDFVSFCANGQTATYSATGTTLDVQVTLQR